MPTTNATNRAGIARPQWLLIGASARYIAESASQAGVQCCAIDMFVDRDLGQVCTCAPTGGFSVEEVQASLNQLKAIVPQLPSQIVVAGGTENHCETLKWLETDFKIAGTTPESMLRARCPRELVRALGRHGIAFPEIQLNPQVSFDCTSFLQKPYRSAGGCGIGHCNAELLAAADWEEFYLQRFVAGAAYGSTFVSDGRRCQMIGTSEQLIGRREFGVAVGSFSYCGSVGPIELEPQVHAGVQRMGETLALEFNLRGVFGIDWVQDDAGKVWLIEINPRIPSSAELYERAGLIDSVFGLHVANGELPELHQRIQHEMVTRRVCEEVNARELTDASGYQMVGDGVAVSLTTGCFGKAIVYSPIERPFRVSQALADELWTDCLAGSLADVPEIGRLIESGQPVCTVFVAAESARAVGCGLQAEAGRWVERIKKLTPAC